MVAVGRPVWMSRAALLRTWSPAADHDHGIQIPAEPVHGTGESLYVGLGEIALIRRGLDQIDGKGGKELPVTAQRILIGREDGAAIGLNRLCQSGQLGGMGTGADGVGRDSARARLRGRLLSAARFPFRLGSCLRCL